MRLSVPDAVSSALKQLPASAVSCGACLHEALETLEQWISTLCIDELMAAEALLRGVHAYGTDTTESYGELLDRSSAVRLILSCHRSGYIREAAVRRLAQSNELQVLPFLLLRVNDWVPQVCEVAKKAVLARVHDRNANEFVRCLPLVERLRRAHRSDHDNLLAAIDALVLSRAENLYETLRHGPPRIRRFVFLLLTRNHDSNAVREGLANDDPLIRLEAMRLVPATFPATEAEQLLRSATEDRSARVRTEALSHFLGDRALLERMLFDRNANLRDFARFHLREAGIDFAARYRAAITPIAPPKQLAVAIGGLAATGSAKDAETLRPYLAHLSTSARRAAVKAVMRLDGARSVDAVAPLLLDPLPSVSAAARDALRPQVALLDLGELFTRTAALHARRNVVQLMNGASKWRSIALLLEALQHPDVAELARDKIEYWNRSYNRSQTVPSRGELRAFGLALVRARHLLGDPLFEDLHALIRVYA
ncbi:MAG TPA: hypothetical protein VHW00_21690 [Thermoanaerobaculia bacterium]|nr:hypothetical protein [Thermoanaerobaculia bacterium]